MGFELGTLHVILKQPFLGAVHGGCSTWAPAFRASHHLSGHPHDPTPAVVSIASKHKEVTLVSRIPLTLKPSRVLCRRKERSPSSFVTGCDTRHILVTPAPKEGSLSPRLSRSR